MRKLMLVASLIAAGGAAGAAFAADQTDQARYHTMSNRTLVWHAPKAEQPYALRGEQRRAEQPRVELRYHGRAGTSIEVRPQATR